MKFLTNTNWRYFNTFILKSYNGNGEGGVGSKQILSAVKSVKMFFSHLIDIYEKDGDSVDLFKKASGDSVI
jgi:hypothetical protein